MAQAKQIPYYSSPALGVERRDKSGVYRYIRDNFSGAGVDSYTKPPAQDEDMFEKLTNIQPPLPGVLQRRWGYNKFSTVAFTASRMFSYQNDSTGNRYLVGTSPTATTALTEAGASYAASLYTPGVNAIAPIMINSRSYGYFVDGVESKKWNGAAASGVFNWGITAPVTAISVGAPAAGSVTLTSGRNYYLVFFNSASGHYSDLSPVSASTGPITNQNIPLSSLAISADPQVDQKAVLATSDGGDQTKLYLLTTVANAVTTATDSTPETTLITQEVFQETDSTGVEHGVADNAPPPLATTVAKHRGRIFLAKNQTLYFSKSLPEMITSTGNICGKYEESFPADFQTDVSEEAENIRGLLSDGTALWVGTERHIRRLDGDSPENFSTPQIIYNQVGLLNQDVWQVVFLEGQPIGTMWLTPDFKVMGSDFNTYQDVGAPVQDILNSINTSVAQSTARAMVALDGEYDFYCLFVPTGSNTSNDTLLVYDLHLRHWYVWNLTDLAGACLFNINSSGITQWLFNSSGGTFYQIGSAFSQDRIGNTPVNITSTIRTSWLHMGDPALRKWLNEVEILTGDPAALVTVEGAQTTADFTTPTAIVTNAALVTGPFGVFKVYLAGQPSAFRYYRLTITSSSTVQNLLETMSFEAIPVHRI